jgi:hypothetical protein
VGFLCGGNTQSGSKACSNCMAGWYLTGTGECAACPPRTLGSAILPIVYSFCFFLAVCLGVAGGVRMWEESHVKRGVAPPPKIPLAHLFTAAAQQAIWGWATLQVVVQAVRAAPTTDAVTQTVVSWVSILQWGWQALPPTCTNTTDSQPLVAAAVYAFIAMLLLLASQLLSKIAA